MKISSHGAKGGVGQDQSLQNHLQRGLIRGPWEPAKGLKLESDMVTLVLWEDGSGRSGGCTEWRLGRPVRRLLQPR